MSAKQKHNEAAKTKETLVVPMNSLGSSSFKIRMSMYAGGDIIVTYHDYPYMYLRAVRDDDDFEGLEIITTQDFLQKRSHIVELIGKGNSFLLTFYSRNLALASPVIPQEALERATAQGIKMKESFR